MPLARKPEDYPNPWPIGWNKHWLTAKKAAEYLGRSHRTLENWRSSETGPLYAKAGARVLYHKQWLDQWLEHL